ncbi:SIS domain-containing protein [Alicyclobacillus fastidiosus]|uniref:SIS domain-containing protein n=1 Tax=Alicyclobacillus fastidiosus TaxID=392011 RepID=A0ABV5AEG3_9BACL|nr:SIS domain-containing protein [Alicyclobacillus fastidiosus]WEH09755.1 SIS domain-containing protein [Alicyclobacillus fastidiosus]
MAETVMTQYLQKIIGHLETLHQEEAGAIEKAARLIADHVKQDKIVYVYGPGGHSNLGSQELFFRAGGLMHISAILDEGTLLSGGALRSMAIERTPGYGTIVIDDYNLQAGDILIIVNAYGINSATIDAALEAKRRGVTTIGVTSVKHASSTPEDHPARHPSRKNLFEVVDLVLDSKIVVGDAVVEIEHLDQRVGAMSTFANAYLLNCVVVEAIQLLVQEGVTPPIWMSGNATGGDEANARFIERFKGRIKKL